MIETRQIDNQGLSGNILKVKIERGESPKSEYYFKDSFTIGRSEDCSIRIDSNVVSRVHAEVKKEGNKWLLTDKNSSNGTFLSGKKIERIELTSATTIELGKNGPILLFTFESEEKPAASSASGKDPSVTSYIKHYFDESQDDKDIGQHTRVMRQAFKVVKKKQTSKFMKIIIIVGVIALIAAAYAVYQHIKVNQQKELAENIFYDMKSLELEISALRDTLALTADERTKEALRKFDARRKQLENNYDKLVDDLGVYNMSEEDKLIIKVARKFGECELTMPKDFIDEVKKYIHEWHLSPRLINALGRAKQYGFTQVIVNNLASQNLTPEFFYLALQESDFKPDIVGPATRWGCAKGVWQMIASTAKRYGLAVGPLADQRIYDARDERYNILKASRAASRYLNDIYNSDAQASGLLVVASYNWGENNILGLIRTMPENPRQRNFWKLLTKYKNKIPKETYNYVFYIFSAAVIGENPKLFGFNFNDPLTDAVKNLKQYN